MPSLNMKDNEKHRQRASSPTRTPVTFDARRTRWVTGKAQGGAIGETTLHFLLWLSIILFFFSSLLFSSLLFSSYPSSTSL